MNKQKTSKGRGIEWTDYTWNPIAGCFHACQWQMPDGSIANCYAEDVANKVAGAAYPNGFEHHYFKPELLDKPRNVKTPSRIFVGSMADVFGHWVKDEQIEAVLDVARNCKHHTFQFLTKNPKRVLEFSDRLPSNVWIGASTPPDFMWNKPLNYVQRSRMLETTLRTLNTLHNVGVVTWLSAEPITIDVGEFIKRHVYEVKTRPIDWIVVGAASNGRTLYAPSHDLVVHAVHYAEQFGVKVFFKGNMKTSLWATDNWREEFPA